MVASRKTIEEVYAVIKRAMDDDTITKLLAELVLIRGNTSFNETMSALHRMHAASLLMKARNKNANTQT